MLYDFHRQLPELWWDGNGIQLFLYLVFQLIIPDGFLLARAFSLGAVIVGIVAGDAVFLMLGFVFCRDKATTLLAANHSRESEGIGAEAGIALLPQEFLNAVVFVPGYHRFVLSLIPVAASFGILELSVIEGVGENTVGGASRHLATILHPQAPFVGRNVQNLGRCIISSQHQVKHLSHEWKAFFISHDFLVAFLFEGIVDIADGREGRIPAALRFGTQSALGIHAQVSHELICHSEFYSHHNHIVCRVVAPPIGEDMLHDALL